MVGKGKVSRKEHKGHKDKFSEYFVPFVLFVAAFFTTNQAPEDPLGIV